MKTYLKYNLFLRFSVKIYFMMVGWKRKEIRKMNFNLMIQQKINREDEIKKNKSESHY